MTRLDTAALQAASQDDKKQAVEDLVKSAPEGERKDVAEAVASALTPEQRAELATSWIPAKSRDKMIVYVAALAASVVLAIGLTLIAVGQQGTDGSISSQIMTAMTGMTGLILGGLFGAYRGS